MTEDEEVSTVFAHYLFYEPPGWAEAMAAVERCQTDDELREMAAWIIETYGEKGQGYIPINSKLFRVCSLLIGE